MIANPHRHPDPQLVVQHAVDVVDDRSQRRRRAVDRVRPASGDHGVVHLDAALGEQPQHHVVRLHPLDVAQGGRAMPKVRTATIATSSRICGW